MHETEELGGGVDTLYRIRQKVDDNYSLTFTHTSAQFAEGSEEVIGKL